MNNFDFISDSPRSYIFQKGSNKINLGGIFTLIYLIILISIFIGYIYDYISYEKYEYNYFNKYFLNEDQIKEKKKDPEYNPPINFSFEIKNKQNELLNGNFTLFVGDNDDTRNHKEIKMGEIINKKDDEFFIAVFYSCKGENCTDSDTYEDFLYEDFNFTLSYDSKIIDFESPNSPVISKKFTFTIPFIIDNYIIVMPIWTVYNYEEQKGIFSRLFNYLSHSKNNWTYGDIEDYNFHDYSRSKENKIQYDNKTDTNNKPILFIRIVNPLERIQLFKRKSLSLMDYFANIAALGTTIFNILCKAFGILYSQNFDNYKIVENILSKEIKKPKE